MNSSDNKNLSLAISSEQPDSIVAIQLAPSGLITYELLNNISLVLICLIQVFNILGSASNFLNIFVFYKLGFSESSNVSLFALSISDLVSVILSLWSNLCLTPAFKDAQLPFRPDSVAVLAGSGLWTFVIRGTAWITAFISFERFLCIMIPLKVKRIITTKTTTIVICVVTILTVGPYIGMYWRWTFVWTFYPHLNRTVLDVMPIDTPDRKLLEEVTNSICGVVQPLLAFFIVVMCTFFLVIHLRRTSAWRQSVASSAKSVDTDKTQMAASGAKGGVSTKDERVVKLVVVIATIFIICFTPSCVMIFASTAFKEYAAFRRYQNIYVVSFLISQLAQSISASINIIIYYKMATKYRLALRQMLGLDKKE